MSQLYPIQMFYTETKVNSSIKHSINMKSIDSTIFQEPSSPH